MSILYALNLRMSVGYGINVTRHMARMSARGAHYAARACANATVISPRFFQTRTRPLRNCNG